MTTTCSIPHELGSSGSELVARDSSGTPTVRSTHARAKPPAAAVAADRNVRRGRTGIGLLREWLVRRTLTLPCKRCIKHWVISCKPWACRARATGRGRHFYVPCPLARSDPISPYTRLRVTLVTAIYYVST